MCVYAYVYVDCKGNISVPVFYDNIDVQIVQDRNSSDYCHINVLL